ncbi:hypothetical protein MCOR25_005572 [Pyricularia grisea]|nr:hypothetical protein MCOR25_005572 [Pyricularia grisea]
MNITYDEPISPPVPVLIGHDIFKLYEGSSDQVYLMLTTNDWGGDVQYAKEQIFDSLRPHSYDNESHEVHIKGINITIALERHIEELELEEPRKLFHMAGNYPETAALYYNEEVPIKIGTDGIGGTRDNDHLSIQDLSTIMSKFRDGKPVVRMILKRKTTTRNERKPVPLSILPLSPEVSADFSCGMQKP